MQLNWLSQNTAIQLHKYFAKSDLKDYMEQDATPTSIRVAEGMYIDELPVTGLEPRMSLPSKVK